MASMTKMQLFEKLTKAQERQQNLEMALGRVRADIMNLNFPSEHRETMDNVMKIVDNAIKNA